MYLHGRGVWGRLRLHYNKKTSIFFYGNTSLERGVGTERLHRDTSLERGVGTECPHGD